MLAWRVGQKHKSGANVVGVGVRREWISHRFYIKAVVLHKEKPPRPLNRDAMNSKIVIHSTFDSTIFSTSFCFKNSQFYLGVNDAFDSIKKSFVWNFILKLIT